MTSWQVPLFQEFVAVCNYQPAWGCFEEHQQSAVLTSCSPMPITCLYQWHGSWLLRSYGELNLKANPYVTPAMLSGRCVSITACIHVNDSRYVLCRAEAHVNQCTVKLHTILGKRKSWSSDCHWNANLCTTAAEIVTKLSTYSFLVFFSLPYPLAKGRLQLTYPT